MAARCRPQQGPVRAGRRLHRVSGARRSSLESPVGSVPRRRGGSRLVHAVASTRPSGGAGGPACGHSLLHHVPARPGRPARGAQTGVARTRPAGPLACVGPVLAPHASSPYINGSMAFEVRRRSAVLSSALAPDWVARIRAGDEAAFVLSRREGLSYREVALRMTISPKTVGVHIGRALAVLRKAMALAGK